MLIFIFNIHLYGKNYPTLVLFEQFKLHFFAIRTLVPFITFYLLSFAKLVVKRNYHMVFFISDPSSVGYLMIFLSYTWHKKTFPEIDELQCDADYGKSRRGNDIFHNRVRYIFLYQPAKVISGRCFISFIFLNFYITW